MIYWGREIKDIAKYPINSFYIKNSKKYTKISNKKIFR